MRDEFKKIGEKLKYISKYTKDVDVQTKKYAVVPEEIYLRDDLTKTELRLYLYLLQLTSGSGYTWKSQSMMAKELKLQRKTVTLGISGLLEKNLILTDHSEKKTNNMTNTVTLPLVGVYFNTKISSPAKVKPGKTIDTGHAKPSPQAMQNHKQDKEKIEVKGSSNTTTNQPTNKYTKLLNKYTELYNKKYGREYIQNRSLFKMLDNQSIESIKFVQENIDQWFSFIDSDYADDYIKSSDCSLYILFKSSYAQFHKYCNRPKRRFIAEGGGYDFR